MRNHALHVILCIVKRVTVKLLNSYQPKQNKSLYPGSVSLEDKVRKMEDRLMKTENEMTQRAKDSAAGNGTRKPKFQT